MDSIIRFENVTKLFSGLTVLDNISFSIPKGKKTFILGQSGEGKSVIIKHILGLLLPDSGWIYFGEEKLPNTMASLNKNFLQWRHVRQKIGCMFQEGALLDSLSVKQNLQLILKENHLVQTDQEEFEAIESSLKAVLYQGDLDRRVYSLSVGERKRVGLARALLCQPEIMIYDEPTTSMDPTVSEGLDELVEKIHGYSDCMTSIVISHDVISLRNLADYIIFLSRGSICYEGDAKTFFQSKDEKIVQFRTGDTQGPLGN